MFQKDEASQAAAYRSSTASKMQTPAAPAIWGKYKAESYHEVYGTLQKVSDDNFYGKVFANGPASHSSPLVSRKSLEILPKMYSFDAPVLDFIKKLSTTLNDELPVDLDEDGFTRTGIHTNFDRLRSVAGYFATPMSYVANNNALYREELGLSNTMDTRQRTIAKNVWDIVWKEAIISPVNVAKLSTGGMRRFTSDVQWKLAYAEWLFEPVRFEKVLDAIASEDWLTLANEYEMVFAMYLQKRGQTDAPGKVRTVFDIEYALSGGTKGKAFPADKRVVINGRDYPDFSAIRARVVQAGPWVINCFLQIASSAAMKSLFDRFPSTFHVNTPEQISAVVEGKYVYCSDVTEYDRSMGREDLLIAHDVMSEYWDERFVKASWRLLMAPYYAKPLGLDGRRGTWVGDPRDWKSETVAGNRSGHAFTSLIAKVNKVIDSLAIIDLIYPVVGREELYLQGKGVIGLVNNGDDEIVWAMNKLDIKKFATLRSDPKLGRYKVEPEVGQGFSGQLLVRTGDTSYRPQARVHSALEKIWVPERSIGGFHREFWPIGMVDRINNISQTDVGQRAWEVHMKLYRDMLAPIYGDFMTIVTRAHAQMRINVNELSRLEKDLIEDPNKIHYSISDDDVSEGVLSMVTSKIPKQVTERIINRYYKGNVK